MIDKNNNLKNIPLNNTRHEKFALALAQGKSKISAYKLAGYRPDTGAASRLSANVSILARVAELRQNCATRNDVSLDNIIAELEKSRSMSMALGQCSAAVMASMGKAKLLGLGEK